MAGDGRYRLFKDIDVKAESCHEKRKGCLVLLLRKYQVEEVIELGVGGRSNYE
jgi:hypothetical protein